MSEILERVTYNCLSPDNFDDPDSFAETLTWVGGRSRIRYPHPRDEDMCELSILSLERITRRAECFDPDQKPHSTLGLLDFIFLRIGLFSPVAHFDRRGRFDIFLSLTSWEKSKHPPRSSFLALVLVLRSSLTFWHSLEFGYHRSVS